MKYKYLIYSLIILFLFGIQLGLFFQVDWLKTSNWLLIFLVFLLVDRYDYNLWWLILITGILVDLFSPLPMGIITFLLIATGIIVRILNNKFFTNLSLYTLIFLGIIGSTFYKFFLYIIRHLTFTNNIVTYYSDISLGSYLVAYLGEILFMAFLFFTFYVFKKKTI